MNTLTIQMDFPKEMIGVLDVPENQISNKLRELIVLELVRNDKISTGKGAEILNMSKYQFISMLSRHDIPYFTDSPEELVQQVATAHKKLTGYSK